MSDMTMICFSLFSPVGQFAINLIDDCSIFNPFPYKITAYDDLPKILVNYMLYFVR